MNLRRTGPITLLIDNSVLGQGVIHETAWITTGKNKWGRHDVETGYSARIPVHSVNDESVAYENIKYLPGIVSLARRGLVILRTSSELLNERISLPAGLFTGYGWDDYSLFSKLNIESIDGWERPKMDPHDFNLPSPVQQMRERLDRSDDVLFRALVDRLGPKNSQDAWHIRTAEAHGLFCFLTMDFKLIRNLFARRNQPPFQTLRTRILTPSQLGEHLHLLPIPVGLFSYHNARFPVRPDLNWPDSKRRPRKSYRKNTK